MLQFGNVGQELSLLAIKLTTLRRKRIKAVTHDATSLMRLVAEKF